MPQPTDKTPKGTKTKITLILADGITVTINTPHTPEEVQAQYIGTTSVLNFDVLEDDRRVKRGLALYDRSNVKALNIFELRDEDLNAPRERIDPQW